MLEGTETARKGRERRISICARTGRELGSDHRCSLRAAQITTVGFGGVNGRSRWRDRPGGRPPRLNRTVEARSASSRGCPATSRRATLRCFFCWASGPTTSRSLGSRDAPFAIRRRGQGLTIEEGNTDRL